MGLEQQPSPLQHIHIDLAEGSITFTGTDGRGIIFRPTTLLRQLLQDGLSPEPENLVAEQPPEEEKEKLITLPGKLKTKPKEGYPDSKGRPTATALFAAHIEEARDAKMYFATFHGPTREIVMNLAANTALVVAGYPHPAPSPDKSDTLSVMRLDDYPGRVKPSRGVPVTSPNA